MDDPDAPGTTAGGLFDSLRSLIATLVAMAHTRVELFGTELEEELRRVVAFLLGGVLVIALASMALLFGGLVVIAAYWDTHRVAATVWRSHRLRRARCSGVSGSTGTDAAAVTIAVVDPRRTRTRPGTAGQADFAMSRRQELAAKRAMLVARSELQRRELATQRRRHRLLAPPRRCGRGCRPTGCDRIRCCWPAW